MFLNRVDSFDINTQTLRQVGYLSCSLSNAYSFFHAGNIIIVGGQIYVNRHCPLVLSFNVQTGVTTILLEGLVDDSVSCFDGVDNIYILSAKTLTRYTLSSKQSINLAKCPLYQYSCPFIYDTFVGEILYLCGTSKNYRYSTSEDKWTRIKSNDKVLDRNWFGACLIRD
ncbi:hypothetical protein SAMD00019534_100630 [Acytostelium subglobosum LB1]|uniref:hypothetical protein n=1 Tax=Acytostelium subglobosum LB1 TaxID=1410327 RepID=UPI000645185A|nr:hypothetical protein SAMD00019534_100630 [Acytostelium subglobosum LB1]GAM26888.1 hypothetical protein SAMD00019534_100630 [Acytostelium subglobosum LB1]|eukprot:XP_012750156.1 hypothetical protein SAMD00019534_100630 [Acytostelium subglobosum LB1]